MITKENYNVIDDSIYWDLRRTLTHNRLFNIIVGNRGGGKSYGAKWYVIDNFLKTGEQFGYIRRYKEDLKEPMIQFFTDIQDRYPTYEFKTDSKYFYMREKREDTKDDPWTEEDICGYGFVLSTASNKKSISYPNITTLIFDEFLIDKGTQRYLPNEPVALLNLYETIARPGTNHKRVIMFMLANALTITNPYFLYWDLKMPTKKDKNGKWIWKHKTRPILVEDVRNEKFINRKRNTEFGKLIAGTSYEGYSIDNKFLLDSDTFIEKRDPNAMFYFSFIYKDKTLGVWANFTLGLMYVSEKYDPSFPLCYSITMKDHRPNTMFLKTKVKDSRFKAFMECYKLGNVRFENMQIKNICYEIIKMSMNI